MANTGAALVYVRMPQELVERLDALAKKTGLTGLGRSGMIVRATGHALPQLEAKPALLIEADAAAAAPDAAPAAEPAQG